MCIVKGKAQNVHFSGDFLGGLTLSGVPDLQEPLENPWIY